MNLTQTEIDQAIKDLERIQEENPGAILSITRSEDGKDVSETFSMDQLKQLKANG